MVEIIIFEKNIRNDFIEQMGKYLSDKYKVEVKRNGKKLTMLAEEDDIRNKLIKIDIKKFLKSIANDYRVNSLEDGTIRVKIFERIRGEVKKTPKSKRYRGKYLCPYCGLDHAGTIWQHIHTQHGGFH